MKQLVKSKRQVFRGSEQYWVERYRSGGNSGAGSYNKLAMFKAEILNDFVAQNQIATVMEFGSGDGNQLRLANYPSYTGFDVSPDAVVTCRALFAHDPSKSFRLVKEYVGEQADLSLSLDVIYHLVEDGIYDAYLGTLFDSAKRFVIIYSTNSDERPTGTVAHVRHRKFSDWIERNRPAWNLLRHIPNRFPFRGDDREGSAADFYIYRTVELAAAR